ncbi:uncharacterized protein LOC109610671 [Ooceraea biroi]|uniref:uncharacterized protein LOC109610671 n=1 Tax=Ooceraea biroi TaxID=2015173 RepID=UPI000F08B1AB|nr:uncharacterized protein LOC109610671 [Ooceraea biroi]
MVERSIGLLKGRFRSILDTLPMELIREEFYSFRDEIVSLFRADVERIDSELQLLSGRLKVVEERVAAVPDLLLEVKRTLSTRLCKSQHHMLLHRETASSSVTPVASTSSHTSPSNDTSSVAGTPEKPIALSHVAATVDCSDSPTILATAKVRILVTGGNSLVVRALLDQGSEVSLIRESLVQLLRLPRHRSLMHISGVGSRDVGATRGVVSLRLQSCVEPSDKFILQAYILPQFTRKIPSEPITSSWEHLQGLPFADPDFAIPGPINLLLGANIYGLLLKSAIRKGPLNAPVAQETSLGWIVSRPTSQQSRRSGQVMTVSISSSSDVNLDEALQRFWEQEEVPALPCARLTAEELECVNHFRSTHSRDSTRRYIVHLPFRSGCGELGSSRSAALRLLERMQHQIRRDATFGQLYVDFMKEYEALEHMTLSSNSSSTGANFLPHHGVLRQNISTTKLRVVFNGSARTSSGLSLNDCLHVGPKLHQDIVAVLLRWRVHTFVFAADIEKMFRQILLHADDRYFQKILWSASGTPLEYFLGTLTYGLVSSPYQSIQTLLQLADNEEHRFPLAANVLRSDFYVDDVLSGDDTPQLAYEKALQLTNLLKAGGFKLQKWSTNESSILEDIVVPAPSNSSTREFDAETRMLGLTWHPSSDTFHFRVSQSDSSVTPTKRIVFSRVSQLFDPLGWLSPVTILGKIFIQSLWKAQVGWDEPLSPSLSQQWNFPESYVMFKPTRFLAGCTLVQILKLSNFMVSRMLLRMLSAQSVSCAPFPTLTT